MRERYEARTRRAAPAPDVLATQPAAGLKPWREVIQPHDDVAVRAQAPIFAADDVIEESAIEMEGDEINEEEIVSEFRSFLDKVSAEDFAEAEVEDEEVGDGEEAEREDDREED